MLNIGQNWPSQSKNKYNSPSTKIVVIMIKEDFLKRMEMGLLNEVIERERWS